MEKPSTLLPRVMEYCVLQHSTNNQSATRESTTTDCLSYCTTNCTGWIYRSESITNSAWLSTVVCSARLRHTWRISAHRSPISPV